MRAVWSIAALIALCWLGLAACAPEPVPTPRQDADRLHAAIAAEQIHNTEDVDRFYTGNGNRAVWTGPANAAHLDALIDAVGNAESHGLDPAHYHLSILRMARGQRPDMVADRFITDVFFTLAAHLQFGKVDPLTIVSTWTFRRSHTDAASILEDALQGGDIAGFLEALAPQHREYQQLRNALRNYRRLAQEGPWPQISDGPALHPGDRSPRVTALRARLEASGDLASTEIERDLFTPELEQAVIRFQRQSALDFDGVVGAETRALLNRGPAERMAQIRVSLERWRWLPRELGNRHIRVNIASFQLQAWEDGQLAQTHEAIVGITYRQTPVFSADMRYLVLNPWWETPPSIAIRDKLPQFRREPEVIERMGYEILDAENNMIDPATIDWNSVSAAHFPYRIRQRPGPMNALGQIKFIFPNEHSVYIHDTPSRELFGEGRRTFSSGCIRTADPLALADWVLADREDWSPESLRNAVETGTETRIDLNRPIPVHILYFTVVADDDSGIHFLNDVYERDRAVLTALDVPPGADEDLN